LFAKTGFYENLRHRFRRTKTNINNFEDIYDGSEYKKHCNPGILDFQQNISLLWNTDGVPVFKSSNFSIWPLYSVINKLPFSEHTKRENMIFTGLWFGDKTIYANIFATVSFVSSQTGNQRNTYQGENRG